MKSTILENQQLGPFTVFVPVDQAFELLIERFGGKEEASKQFEENPEVLEGVPHSFIHTYFIDIII